MTIIWKYCEWDEVVSAWDALTFEIGLSKSSQITFLLRLMALCLTPMFYIVATEKEKLKPGMSKLISIFSRSNSVTPVRSIRVHPIPPWFQNILISTFSFIYWVKGSFPSCIQCTMGKLQWEVGNRKFSFLREKYFWNIWTRIKWEAKLTNISEIFGRC